MKKNFFLENRNKILKSQIVIFLLFSLLVLLYNFDDQAHKYYNNSVEDYNFHSIFSLLMIALFGLFFWISMLYPFF
ncbi:hypothetical protein BWK63_12940 [Flavobacterium covae]|nr:hypothetical protein BWK63_12940 [Flavobacterium covae]POR20642.1 hypothetical protein BWK57_12850 [Flavobacterium columnare]